MILTSDPGLALLDGGGEETVSRLFVASAAVSSASGRLRISCFRARRTEPIKSIRSISGSTAAGATPTLCRVGVYSLDASANGTLIASIASDTTLWASTNTEYLSALTATWNKQAGARYAIASLCVTAAAAPTFTGYTNAGGMATAFARSPQIAYLLDGQADLPASWLAANLTASANAVYFEAVP